MTLITRVSTVLALRRKQHIANLSCLCCFWRNPNTVETLRVLKDPVYLQMLGQLKWTMSFTEPALVNLYLSRPL